MRRSMMMASALLVSTPGALWACGNSMYEAEVPWVQSLAQGYATVALIAAIPAILGTITTGLISYASADPERRRSMANICSALFGITVASVFVLPGFMMPMFGPLPFVHALGVAVAMIVALVARALYSRSEVWSRRVTRGALLAAVLILPMFAPSFVGGEFKSTRPMPKEIEF